MHCTHFFPHDFVRSISPGILSRWALRPEHDRSPKYQSSQCCPNPWKKPTGFWKKRPEMTPMWDFWRKSFILKKPHLVFFLGAHEWKVILWKKCVLLLKATFFVQPVFFLQTRDTWKWRDRTPVFFRIFKKHFKESFIYKQKACKNVKFNISKSWKSVIDSPFNPYMLTEGYFFWSNQISRTIPQPTHRLNGNPYGFTWHLLAKSRWGQTALKGGK